MFHRVNSFINDYFIQNAYCCTVSDKDIEIFISQFSRGSFNDTIAQGAYLKGGIGKLIFDLIDMSRRALLAFGMKDKANGIMFILNMPWRNAARMSGVLTDQQIKALLKLINRRR